MNGWAGCSPVYGAEFIKLFESDCPECLGLLSSSIAAYPPVVGSFPVAIGTSTFCNTIGPRFEVSLIRAVGEEKTPTAA